jgi:hypothetical protein
MTSLMGIGIKRGSAQEIGIVDEPLRSFLRIQALDVSLDDGPRFETWAIVICSPLKMRSASFSLVHRAPSLSDPVIGMSCA